ncbi:MAG: GNAT family N-acetyltransferase [Dehalococcoidia bacterium]|jgi:ribosomal protein S18 acetylase RimI-like enzyme|nr:GNAT family N-acetyltransferase [Dehalococcoidia bacterium]
MSEPTVSLVPVDETEYDDFFEMFEVYDAELQPFETVQPQQDFSIDAYRQAVLADMAGRELMWVMTDDRRAGLVMTRTTPDWPDDRDETVSISEFYIVPSRRRVGVGRAAVEALMAEHRRRGTALVQAAILRENEGAFAFWASVGFEVQFLQTSRSP